VIVVHFAAQEPFGGVNHGLTPDEHSVQGSAGMVPEREAYDPAFSILPAKRMPIEFMVFLGGATEQAHLLRVEEAFDL